ncbi:MAG TPA: FAD-binding oxidoreductase [Solirubrobacteraceae bacterium]|nr:FAD-binding oxidoreductase [Solirubrobacteraceae bacterium]
MDLEPLAARIREHGTAGQAVRPVGGGTKLAWGGRGSDGAVDLETSSLNEILEHNVGDFTAVLGAGVRLADAQAVFAAENQMLALDPPLGAADGATVGGMIATADSGPLRHRYGGVRDLVVGMTVILSDGTVAKSGGKVIKNVAGYDLAKLFTGSYGTLGLIASVAVRLHPLPGRNATAIATSEDPMRLAAAAADLAARPLEADSLDVCWDGDRGHVLVRFGAAAAEHQAEAAADQMRGLGLDDVRAEAEDDEIWNRERALQRSADGIVLKVSGRPTDLPAVVEAARGQRGTVVTRAALGLSWLALPAGADVPAVRAALAPRPVTVLDGADQAGDAWPAPPEGTLAVMARLKERFDPARIFRPGAYVGGL